MSGTNAELIAEARQRARMFGRDHGIGSMVYDLADALEAATLTSVEDQMYVKRMEAERDAALAVIAGVAAVIAKLAEHIDNPEDISEYWREAFDATYDIEDILAEVTK